MREIKFRGQRTDNKEWVYGYYLKITEGIRINHIIIVENIPKSIIDCTYIRYYVIPESVGQFTGIKDKNGKEIFEGDKVESLFSDGKSCLGEVVFADGCWEVLFSDNERDYLKVYVGNHAIEIIGNKFETPELLKEDLI